MNLRDNSLGENYVLFRNWAILTIFGLNFLQKTANRDFVKILRFAVSVFLNFYCGSVLVRFGLDTLIRTFVILITRKNVSRSIEYSSTTPLLWSKNMEEESCYLLNTILMWFHEKFNRFAFGHFRTVWYFGKFTLTSKFFREIKSRNFFYKNFFLGGCILLPKKSCIHEM